MAQILGEIFLCRNKGLLLLMSPACSAHAVAISMGYMMFFGSVYKSVYNRGRDDEIGHVFIGPDQMTGVGEPAADSSPYGESGPAVRQEHPAGSPMLTDKRS
jgi:hypothetical protein